MGLTKKTHYNPCFWTAYWNFDYLKRKIKNPNLKENTRKKEVFVLNLKSDKIYKDVTENISFKKKLGLAKITKEGAIEFTKRNFPNHLKKIKERYETNDSDITLDFENIFTMMEDSYKEHLEKLVFEKKLVTTSDKANLTFFILFQLIRNPDSLEQNQEVFELNGMEKFELLFFIKNQISDLLGLGKLTSPFSIPTWTIYKLNKNKFPLSDNPVMIKNHHLMVAISPNIMLELNLKEKCNEVKPCYIKRRISYFKYREFIKRTIKNSSKEIIFGEEKLLKRIKKSRKFKLHLRKVNSAS